MRDIKAISIIMRHLLYVHIMYIMRHHITLLNNTHGQLYSRSVSHNTLRLIIPTGSLYAGFVMAAGQILRGPVSW